MTRAHGRVGGWGGGWGRWTRGGALLLRRVAESESGI